MKIRETLSASRLVRIPHFLCFPLTAYDLPKSASAIREDATLQWRRGITSWAHVGSEGERSGQSASTNLPDYLLPATSPSPTAAPQLTQTPPQSFTLPGGPGGWSIGVKTPNVFRKLCLPNFPNRQ